MGKGIIVVDTPENCLNCGCKLCFDRSYYCGAKARFLDDWEFDIRNERPDWCPIKPKNDEWIPAEEKMPKDGELVWVTEYGKVKRAYYAGETKLGRVFVQTDGWHKIIEEKNVSAWQPDYIPEPYTGKETQKEKKQ